MSDPAREGGRRRDIDLVLRDLVNALSKAAMYPVGHKFISDSSAALVDRLSAAMADRESLAIGILPHGLLIDSAPLEPISAVLREFAGRMHRKNIGTILLRTGVRADEVATLLAALAASNADETVGRDGLRLDHARVEPISYDALTFADGEAEHSLDERFWESLVETAFGRAMNSAEHDVSGAQLADAISDRAVAEADGAHRVYDALTGYAAALTGRHEQLGSVAAERFIALLGALSRTTTNLVLAAAPSSASRRQFLRESLELVPPALLLQLLEGVAEADGQPISLPLRSLLGKVAGAAMDDAASRDTFTAGVLGLVQHWDGVSDSPVPGESPQVVVAPRDTVRLGLLVGSHSPIVIAAAGRMIASGQLGLLLQYFDDGTADRVSAAMIADAVLNEALMQQLLSDPNVDFALVERIALRSGAAAVDQLLDALGAATERTARRRLLDLLVQIGPEAEGLLLARMKDAPWYLVRNILAVLAHFPAIRELTPVLAELNNPELRVRQEALKVLMRQPAARDRASAIALESGEESMIRITLTALGSECPPRLVPAVIQLLRSGDHEVQQSALRTLSDVNMPLVVPPLLDLVRVRARLFRRQRLQPRSAVMLGALEILVRRWRNDRSVVSVIELSRKSPDADVRAAGGAS